MKQHNSTYFRRFMSTIFNNCIESNEPVLITTNKGDEQPLQVVIISKTEFDKLMGVIGLPGIGGNNE